MATAIAIPQSGISRLEGRNMHHAHSYISPQFLADALATPVVIMDAAGPQGASAHVAFSGTTMKFIGRGSKPLRPGSDAETVAAATWDGGFRTVKGHRMF
jgi:hypothetical protein